MLGGLSFAVSGTATPFLQLLMLPPCSLIDCSASQSGCCCLRSFVPVVVYRKLPAGSWKCAIHLVSFGAAAVGMCMQLGLWER